MDAAKHRAGSSVLLDESDTLVEVAAAEEDVVEHCGHLFRDRRPDG
jgi:hypothetical protein